MSSSIKWFDGDSKDALQQMTERNCVFLVYIGNDNEDLIEVFKDPNIIQLLNNELIICFKMGPTSSNFQKFKDIFNSVDIPSIYLLEKNNIQHFIIKEQDLKEFHKIQLDLKHQLLKAIQSVVKNILGSIDIIETKQKYVQYLTVVTNMLQELSDTHIKHDIPKVTKEIKKSNDIAKIKIKIPCKEVTLVQEFQSISSLDDVKTFVLNNVNLPRGTMKFIAHRQFVDEDFPQSLEALELCPSSTIYVHLIPSDLWRKPSIFNFQSWLSSLFYFSVTVPYNFLQYYVTSFFHTEKVTPPQNKKKPVYKPNSNIHQLRNNKPDDDENNTYNGNSTQQL